MIHGQRRRGGASAFGPSSEEIAVALAGVTPVEHPAETAAVAAAQTALTRALAEKPEPLLARLARVLALGELDVAIVCVLLAPELDHDLERAYTFAVDDFTRKRGDIGFIARLIAAGDPALTDRVLLRFDDAAPLRRHGVLA